MCQAISQASCTDFERMFPLLLIFSKFDVLQYASAPETLVEALSILSILINRFPAHMANVMATRPPLMTLAPLLSYPRPLVRKRAIFTLAQLIPMSPPGMFSELLATSVLPSLSQKDANVDKQRTTVHLVAAIARHSSLQISLVLPDIVPKVLEIVQKDDDELREGSLQVSPWFGFASQSDVASRHWKLLC
jgi:cullin-associated NEDD8-dissociated protein 1